MEDQAPSADAEGWTLHAELASMIEPLFAGIKNAGCRARTYAAATWVVRMWGHPAIILSPEGPQWHAMDRCKLAEHYPEIVETKDKARTSVRKLVECGFLEIDPQSVQPPSRKACGAVGRPPLMYRFAKVVADWLKHHAEKLILRSIKYPESTTFSFSNERKERRKIDSGDLPRDAGGSRVQRRYGDRSLDAVIRDKALARSKHLYHPTAAKLGEKRGHMRNRLRENFEAAVAKVKEAANQSLERMRDPQLDVFVPLVNGAVPLDALAAIPDRPAGDEPECLSRLASKLLARRVL